jgi:uncharacterized protein (TIGR02646 family)
MTLFARRENPPLTSNYRDHQPFLRRDFLERCAYCDRTEEYLGGIESFEVEHFKPKSKFPDLICDYKNLYYACRGCNGHKSETWPSEDQIGRGQRFADPCVEDPYVHHLREREDGTVEPLTSCGSYSNGHIRLDRQDVRKWRLLRAQSRRDLPILTGLAHLLEQIVSSSEGRAREEAAERLGALRQRIEESKLRFSIE